MEARQSKQIPDVTLKQVGHEVYFLLTAMLAVSAYADKPWLMLLLIGANAALRFALIGRRDDWIYFLIGVVGGGGNDLISMLKDVYSYNHMLWDVPRMPLPPFMFLFWGHVFVALRQLFRLRAFQGPPIEGRPWALDKRLAADIAVVVAFRIIVYNFVHQEPIPTVGYGAALALRLLLIPPRKHEWRLIAAMIVIGPIFEAALIRLGLYYYYNPVFWGMPGWLYIYWAFIVSIFLKGIFDRIETSRA